MNVGRLMTRPWAKSLGELAFQPPCHFDFNNSELITRQESLVVTSAHVALLQELLHTLLSTSNICFTFYVILILWQIIKRYNIYVTAVTMGFLSPNYKAYSTLLKTFTYLLGFTKEKKWLTVSLLSTPWLVSTQNCTSTDGLFVMVTHTGTQVRVCIPTCSLLLYLSVCEGVAFKR